MSKPWHERPLWWKVFMEDDKAYIHAARIIGHLGCSPFEFWDAAKAAPGYKEPAFRRAMEDLTAYVKREASPPRYELHSAARKVARIILGPAPDDPEYADWWRRRLVSVRLMREQGQPVEWAEEPPVPLPDDEPFKEVKPVAKGRTKKAAPTKEPRKPPAKKPRKKAG